MAYDLNDLCHFGQLCKDVSAYLSCDDPFDYLYHSLNERCEKYDIYEVSVAERVFGHVAIRCDKNLTDKQRRHAAIKMVMNRVGFSNIEDYSKSYPGRYKDGTINRSIISSNFRFEHIYGICRIHSKTCFDDMIAINLSTCNSIVMYPTIEEIMRCDCFGCVDPKNLWFCENWEEVN